MAFKAAFIAHAPDADPQKHLCVIDTGKYKLFVTIVSDQDQAITECSRLAREEGVSSVLLCPGFTNSDIAEIDEAVGTGCSVCVARGDGPGGRIAMQAMKDAGWFD